MPQGSVMLRLNRRVLATVGSDANIFPKMMGSFLCFSAPKWGTTSIIAAFARNLRSKKCGYRP